VSKAKAKDVSITEELWQQNDIKSNNNAFSSPLWVFLQSFASRSNPQKEEKETNTSP
jgi:hypothetical protein